MQAISVTTTRLNLNRLLNKAQQEPLLIRQNRRDLVVMLSTTEYQRLSKHSRASAPPPGVDPRLAALLDACD